MRAFTSASDPPCSSMMLPKYGRATDLTNLEAAARRIAKVSRQPKVIVEKSTVPVKAAETTSTILQFEAKSRRNISSLTITTNNNDNKFTEMTF
ncbi:unnamed protein product [Schistosoma curassoni]|uniref:UDPG_MGDP_dh_N domain-containing protein n=1 Tax=Schistosoma curassoni TaxID=6186 RepID=A0A183JN35_9TREM|nr:unnamed protein product [Schistosoma curassoni]